MSDPNLRADAPAPRPSRGRRWARRLTMLLVGSLFVVGPWPVDDTHFDGSEPQRRTLERLDGMSPVASNGPIRVGLAEVDLTPTTPRPLAGFIGQIRTPFVGVDTRCFARALTVESGSGTVTILTADLLLINAKMARAVLERAGLRAEEVYFTSSHTHGGPGTWGDHPLEMLVAGAYDPAYFEVLADQLAGVVRESRGRTDPAEMAFVAVQARDRQKNRVDPALPTHDALSALVFRPTGAVDGVPPLAILASFGAHATVSHPIPPRVGADYPSSLVASLKERTGAKAVLFASGAVGDASPARIKAEGQAKSAEALGKALANELMAALPSAKFEREVTVRNLRLAVDLPPVRLPFFGAKLRFSPLLTWWIADRQTHLHALRIGPSVLVGFPGDYSGHLADGLDASTTGLGLSTVPTSFDGDFRGYLVAEPVFRGRSCYETRWMSFYGPWLGDYFNDLARRMIERLADQPALTSTPEPGRNDLGRRLALGGLLALGVIRGWRGRGAWPEFVRRTGPITLAIAASAILGFLFDPDLVAWAGVGGLAWVGFLGLPIGLAASNRSDGSFLGFGLACALLSGSWVVVLMGLRIAVRRGFEASPPRAIPPTARPIAVEAVQKL